MKKINNYFELGLFFNGIWILSNSFNLLPSFIEGLCCGVGLTLILIGMYAQNHDISKLRVYKKRLLKKVFHF